MLKSLILIVLLSVNLAFAKSRFTDADKQKFMDEVKQAIAAHKVENKGKVDLQIIKPGLYEELDIYYKQEKFTREEMVKIKQRYEDFAKSSIPADQTENAFYKFVQDQLDELNKTQVAKIKEGQVCNNWSCEDGLKCAPDLKQVDGPSCKKESTQCKDDKDCCSGSCTLDKKSNKHFCEEVYRCYKPLALGQSCMVNPVCGEGECLAYNSKTSGIGECLDNGKSCKKSSDCCSHSCDNHKCVESYVCKDCVKAGNKPARGQKCCEGLYMNDKGICVPDVPPTVIPQVRVKKLENMMDAFAEIIIGSAHADEAWDTVNANRDTYQNFQAKSEAADAVQVNTPVFNLTRKSNFDTCDIRFRDDFMNYLKTSKLIDLELALLSFDFVLSGDGVNDYWMSSNDPQSSIYGRLKTISTSHLAIRKATNDKIDAANKRLTCMCLDVKGYKSITDADKKAFFEKSCDEYQKYLDPNSSFDELQGDASGVKGKRLLVAWTQNLEAFNASLAVDNTGIYQNFANVSQWASYNAKWNDADEKTYSLFTFSMKNPSGSVAAMGAILGALLSAGIIAILGGFATTSILSAWAAAGIIATSAITGGTGLWLIASLKGAWISKRPEVVDKFVRSYSCGKKETCQDWTRTLHQPYNNVCNVHTSANACIKNFVVYYQDSEPRYVVDPWIPYGVAKNLVLRDINDDRDYAHKLEDGFQAAKNQMMAKNPGAIGGGGKDGGMYVAEVYMMLPFVDANVLGSYTPKIGTDDKRYLLDDTIVNAIKDQAKKYAIAQQFFQDGDTDNLNKFADYVYQYHFLWPKTSRAKEISYPTVGLTTYLDLMSNGVSANMAAGATNAAKTFGNLNQQYLQDYLNTLQMYKNNLDPVNTSETKLKSLAAEISKVQQDLSNQRTLNAILANTSMGNLGSLNAAALNSINAANGGTGVVALTSDQMGFLNAVSTLREARKSQLKKLDAYNKAVASSGDSDRATKVATAAKVFSSSFARPLSGSKAISSSSSIFGSGGKDGLGLKTSDDGSKNGSGGKNKNGYGDGYNTYSLGGSGSGSSRSGSGSGKDGSNATADSSGAGANEAANKAADEDARRLQEAIEARNKANKDQYSSNGENTLFEQVTNAYIRNYDKVLIKKKSDKDVQEKK